MSAPGRLFEYTNDRCGEAQRDRPGPSQRAASERLVGPLWVVLRSCSTGPERPLSGALPTLDASRWTSRFYRFGRAEPCELRLRYCIA